jgi:hypothetical protein
LPQKARLLDGSRPTIKRRGFGSTKVRSSVPFDHEPGATITEPAKAGPAKTKDIPFRETAPPLP